jgi:hypothetical protein
MRSPEIRRRRASLARRLYCACSSPRLQPASEPCRMKTSLTSPYAPDLDQVRAWLQKMIAELRFVDLVGAILAFISRMCVINTELTARLGHLQRRRPKSERLAWLERQLLLPLAPVVPPPLRPPASDDQKPPRKRARRNHPGRAALPPPFLRTCNASRSRIPSRPSSGFARPAEPRCRPSATRDARSST